MPLRPRRTASLNGSFRHSKTRVSGSMYFRHLRDAADHSKLDATGTTTSGHSVLWATGASSTIPSATIKPGALIVGERFASPRMVA